MGTVTVAGPFLALLVSLLAAQIFLRREESAGTPDAFDRLDESPYSEPEGAPLVPVADGVYELITPQSSEMHAKCFKLFARSTNKSLVAKATALNARWESGNLSAPCVWSQRMVVVALAVGALVYSPVECTEERAAAVRSLGGAKAIVLPNFDKALHFQSWHKTFPEALVVTVAGNKMVHVLSQVPRAKLLVLGSGRPVPPKAMKLLRGFDVEVVDTVTLEDEIVLHHQASKSLLVSDFVMFGSADKGDASGWPRLGSEKWTHLYYEFHLKFTPYLMPMYRMGISKKQKESMLVSLERILAWNPERVLSAHAGKVSEAGVAHTAEILRSSWRWCNATKRR